MTQGAPLTPPNCDLTDFAFMPLDVARLRDSELAANETPEACWAAVLLWAASWHQVPAASMPKDDRWIAKAAGYAQRGKIDSAWKHVREGALRGWIECDDGRLYHPVVAEKAREAWTAKLKQRWGTECARIKKHNDRRQGANVPKPTFEDWLAAGCPQGQPLYVPGDTPPEGKGSPDKSDSKRQGEGQGQGQGQGDIDSEAKASAGAGASALVDKSTKTEDQAALGAEARRELWASSGKWLVDNRLETGEAKAFMNSVAKDFPRVAAEAFREALKTAAPVDPRAFVTGIAKRLETQRTAPITTPSSEAERTRAALDAQSAKPAEKPSAGNRAALDAIRERLEGKRHANYETGSPEEAGDLADVQG